MEPRTLSSDQGMAGDWHPGIRNCMQCTADCFMTFVDSIPGFWKPFVKVADELVDGFLDIR